MKLKHVIKVINKVAYTEKFIAGVQLWLLQIWKK